MKTVTARKATLAVVLLCVWMVVGAGCGARRSRQLTQEGDIYFRLGKFREAASAYRKALDSDRTNARAKLGEARCAWAEKQAEEAVAAYREAIALDPGMEAAYSEAAQILLKSGDPQGAEDFARQYEGVNARAGGLLRSYVLRETGRLEEAIEVLGGLRERFAESVEVRVALASVYLAAKQPEKAEEELRTILKVIDATSLPAQMALIEVYQEQGRLSEMIEQLRKLAEQNPEAHGLKLALARSLLDAGQIEEAESIARPILKEMPDSGWANYIVGACLLEKKSYVEAAQCLQTAAAALPQEEVIRRKLAEAESGGAVQEEARPTRVEPPLPAAEEGWQTLWQMAALGELISERARFLAEGGKNLQETLALAAVFTRNYALAEELAAGLPAKSPVREYVALLKHADFSAMVKFLDEWQETEADRRILQVNARGYAYALAGMRAQALRIFTECLETWPGHGVAAYNTAAMYRSARMPEFAASCLQKLIAMHPTNSEAREMLFALLLEANRIGDAQLLAESSYALFGERRESILNVAQVYLETGRDDLAVQVLEQSARKRPEDGAVQLALVWARLRSGDIGAAEHTLAEENLVSTMGDTARSAAAFCAAGRGDWGRTADVAGQIQPDSLTLATRFLTAAAYLKMNRPDQAAVVLMQGDGKPVHPEKSRVLLKALGKSVELGVPEAASAEALAANPSALGDYAYGIACQEARLFSDAVRLFSSVDAAVGGQCHVMTLLMHNMARAINMKDRAEQAKQYTVKYADMAEAWMGLAEVNRAMEDAAGERAALDRAVEVSPKHLGAWQQRAQFFDRRQDLAEAVKCYRQLAELDPGNPIVKNNLAYYLLLTKGDAGEALQLAQAAYDAVSKDQGAAWAVPHVLHTLGLAELRAGEIERGKKNLTIALENRPGDPTVLLDFGQLLIVMGRKEDGIRQVEVALRYADLLGLDFPRRAEAEAILKGP